MSKKRSVKEKARRRLWDVISKLLGDKRVGKKVVKK